MFAFTRLRQGRGASLPGAAQSEDEVAAAIGAGPILLTAAVAWGLAVGLGFLAIHAYETTPGPSFQAVDIGPAEAGSPGR